MYFESEKADSSEWALFIESRGRGRGAGDLEETQTVTMEEMEETKGDVT